VKLRARRAEFERSIGGIHYLKRGKMRKIVIFVLALISALLTACDSGASNTNANVYRSNTNSASLNADGISENAAQMSSPQISLEKAAASPTQPAVTERKIIRNAELQLEAVSPEEAQSKITQIVENKGGFVITSTQRSSSSEVSVRDNVSMTVRVPAEKFTETINEIRQTASRVTVETITVQDVTEEFVDIQARLRAKKALEEQFLEIMKRTTSVADALNVQKELGNVRGEIEQVEGRLRFLENQTSLSSINIEIRTPGTFSASSSGFIYQLGDAFSSGFNFALNFILVLITLFVGLLPFLVFIVLPVSLLIRYFLKRSRKQKMASEIAKEEIKEQ
jgi:hypothetical protein